MVRFELVQTTEMIDQVARLARVIWDEAYADILSTEQREYMIEAFQSPHAITQQIEEGMLYSLLFYHDEAVGYLGLGVEDETLLMSKVYVLKSLRGRGLFSKMLELAKDEANKQKRGTIRLYVNKYNIALKAYEAKGFKNVGSVVKDIGQGYIMDDFCMELPLL